MISDFENLPELPAELGVVRQIAYLVEDIDQAMQDWHNTFQVSPFLIMRGATPLSNAYYRGKKAPQPKLDIAFAYVGDMQLELIQQLDDTPSIYKESYAQECAEELGAERSNVHHYAVCVDNFPQAYRFALSNGYVAALDAGVDGLARMSYLENTDIGIMLEMVELNDLTKPYFDGIAALAESVAASQLVHEFKLQQLTPIAAVLSSVGRFALNTLLGRVESTRN